MFGRIFLFLATAISILWLGFATYDRINKTKIFRPEYLFSQADKEVIIISNQEQQALIESQFNIESKAIKAILPKLNTDKIKQIYLSKKRAHLLIITNEGVTKDNIKSFFNQVEPNAVDGKTFTIENFKGKFISNAIYLSSEHFDLNKNPWEGLKYDSNADASIIQFNAKTPSVIDLYVKKHGVVEYKSMLNKNISGIKVNDKEVFSSVIPSFISSYEFYETDYLRFRDQEIYKSPMNSWLKYGLVKIILNGHEALITDYIDGQDPIQVLYDFYQLESKEAESDHFQGKTISNLLSSKKGFYVYQLDDHVVISANRATCEEVVGAYKLGNTLAQNQEKANAVYQLLPQKVNYRKVSKQEKNAASIYESTLLTTVVGSSTASTVDEKPKNTGGPTSFVAGNVKDIYLINERSFFVSTTDNKILFFEGDHKKWEKSLENAIVGEPEIIDLLANGKSQLMVATAKKVHVLDINGNDASGFPISFEEQVNVASPAFYRWKGNGFFALAGEKGRIIQYDNQGRELNVIRTQLNNIEFQPVIWTSANKPFIGVQGENKFEMIQLDTRKSLRSFNAANAQVTLKLPNEIKLYGISLKQLIAYDQRGGLSKFDMTNGQIHPIVQPSNGIVILADQTIQLYNSAGLSWGTIKLPFTDVSDIQIFTTPNGSTFIAAIDGLQNKVYCYKSNGELFLNNQFDGSKIVRYHNGYLFSVIDNLVVRYSMK